MLSPLQHVLECLQPVSFPRRIGQVPIYYNHEPTGRPCDVTSKYNSRYRDLLTCDPLYSFGYGLSYTTFSVSNLQLSSATMSPSGTSVVCGPGQLPQQTW